MPDRARVMEFVSMVVSGDHVGAIADFYHENATMQENRNEPRRGRDILMAQEARALSRVKRMHLILRRWCSSTVTMLRSGGRSTGSAMMGW